MTRLRGFIGPGYTLRNIAVECQRCVNLYPEIDELQTAVDGEVGSLVATPGLRLLGVCGSGPIRGMYVTSTGGMAVVSGSEVYRVGTGWAFTKVGDLLTSNGPVSMADNQTQLCIVDGKHGYIVSLVTGIMTQITDPAFPGADTVTYLDSYFIFNNPGTSQFFWSDGFDGFTYDAANFIANLTPPSAVLGVFTYNRQLWVFCRDYVQPYWNVGGDTTFSRIDGSSIEFGCASAATVKKFANTLIWMGQGANGTGVVWQAQGFTPKRVSNHGVEAAIQSYGDTAVSSATAWAYQAQGHAFYVLNFPTANTSWVYDVATGQWHERAYLGLDGEFQRHRAECYTFGFEENVVGDYQNGNIYALDEDTRTDNGRPLKWLRRSPHVAANGHRVFYRRAQLMARVGTGLDGAAASNEIDPSVELRYSSDFGNTWSTPKRKSLGKLADYAKRVIWNQLGSDRNRVFEVSGSDPVQIALLGMELEAMPGAN